MRSQEHTCPPLKMHLPPAALGNTSARGTSRSETALAASSTSRPQERHSAPSVHLQCPEPPSVSHGTHCHTLGPAMSQALGISFLAPLLLEKETAPCRCPGASDPPPQSRTLSTPTLWVNSTGEVGGLPHGQPTGPTRDQTRPSRESRRPGGAGVRSASQQTACRAENALHHVARTGSLPFSWHQSCQ